MYIVLGGSSQTIRQLGKGCNNHIVEVPQELLALYIILILHDNKPLHDDDFPFGPE